MRVRANENILDQAMRKLGYQRSNGGVYIVTIYTEYQDKFDAEQASEIVSSENPMDEFYDKFGYEDEEYERESLHDSLEKETGLSHEEIWEFIDEKVLFAIDEKHYLGARYNCFITIDTGDSNTKFTDNTVFTDTGGEEDMPDTASLVWLAKTQGYTKQDIQTAITEGQKTGFIGSVAEEINNVYQSVGTLCFLCRATLGDMIAVKNGKGLTISKDAFVGLHDQLNGADSLFDIQLEKSVDIPNNIIREFNVDGHSTYNGYSPDEVHGWSGEAYRGRVDVQSGTVQSARASRQEVNVNGRNLIVRKTMNITINNIPFELHEVYHPGNDEKYGRFYLINGMDENIAYSESFAKKYPDVYDEIGASLFYNAFNGGKYTSKYFDTSEYYTGGTEASRKGVRVIKASRKKPVKAMLVDLILDREAGHPYSVKDFYKDVLRYNEVFYGIHDELLSALDGGSNKDVQEQLKQYINEQGYNPEIKEYIDGQEWVEANFGAGEGAVDIVGKKKKRINASASYDTLLANWGFAWLKTQPNNLEIWYYREDDDDAYARAINNVREISPNLILSSSNDGSRRITIMKDEKKNSGFDKDNAENNKYYSYLNELRLSGVTNMYGAGRYLEDVFSVDRKTANEILRYWMENFEELQGL